MLGINVAFHEAHNDKMQNQLADKTDTLSYFI